MSIAIVIGVSASNGLGAAIARRFAAGGLHVVVAGRRQARLAALAEEISAVGGQCTPCVTDATDAAQIEHLLGTATARGTIDTVVFNVGNNRPLPFEECSATMFEDFWRTCTLSGFLVAKAALPALQIAGGSLLFTGASASMRGKPGFAHFAAAKAGLRSLAQALARDYGPRGVHVGHVVVDGVINGDRVRKFLPEYLRSLGEDGALEPDAIAEAYWFLHKQPRNAWTFEVDLRPCKENW